jgi:hypothetical protein
LISFIYLSIHLFIFIVMLGVHCGIYKSSYNISNIDAFTHSIIFLYPLCSHSWKVSTGFIFPFTYKCTQYLTILTLPHPFPP